MAKKGRISGETQTKGDERKKKAQESKSSSEEVSDLLGGYIPQSDSTERPKDHILETDSRSSAIAKNTPEQKFTTIQTSKTDISPSVEKSPITASLETAPKQDKTPNSGVSDGGMAGIPVTSSPTTLQNLSPGDRESLSPTPLSIIKKTSSAVESVHSHNCNVPVPKPLKTKNKSPGTDPSSHSPSKNPARSEILSSASGLSHLEEIGGNFSQSAKSSDQEISSDSHLSMRSLSQEELPEGAHCQQASQSSPPGPPSLIGGSITHYPHPVLNFIEESSDPVLLWEGDERPAGTHTGDHNKPQIKAHVLGDIPPKSGGRTQGNINAKEWFKATESKGKASARVDGQGEMTDRAIRLQKIVDILRNANIHEVPKELDDWKTFVDDQSNGLKGEATLGIAMVLGNQAVEAAFLLGTAQTSEIITLRYENKELTKVIDSLQRDGGIGVGYITPEEQAEQQKRWDREIEIRDEQIRLMHDRLGIEKKPITKELDKAKAMIIELGNELAKYKKKYRGFQDVNTQDKDQFDRLQNTLLTERDSYKSLRDEISNEKKSTELLGDKPRNDTMINESIEVEKLRLDLQAVQLQIDTFRAQKDLTSSQRRLIIPKDPKISEMTIDDEDEKSPEDEVGAVEVGILRVKLHLHNMVRRRALHGMQKDDIAVAVEVARDTLVLSQTTADESAIARVSFWLGVVLYYSDDMHAALTHFQEAHKPMVLPTFEAGLIEDWLERCLEFGPEKDATEYGGIKGSKRIQKKRVKIESSEPKPQTEAEKTPLGAPETQAENAVVQNGTIGNIVRAFPPARWFRSFLDAL